MLSVSVIWGDMVLKKLLLEPTGRIQNESEETHHPSNREIDMYGVLKASSNTVRRASAVNRKPSNAKSTRLSTMILFRYVYCGVA